MTRWIVAGLGSIPLLVLLGLIAVDVVQARRIDRDFLASRAGLAQELLGRVDPPMQLAPPSPDADVRLWLFGASSFAAPTRELMPDALQARFGPAGLDVVIDNLAWEGLTSDAVRLRVDKALAQAAEAGVQPDVAVIYSGHNDVTTTWHAAMGFPAANPTGFPVSAVVSFPAWFTDPAADYFEDFSGFRFFRNRRMAPLMRLYQQLGLVRVTPEDFAPLMDHVLRTYPANLDAMVRSLRAAGVEVMLVTPVGALAVRPTGPIQVTDALYAEGMAATDYDARMAALIAARDSETFTSDMRTKSPMIEAIRQRGPEAGEGPAPVTVCDVERRFLDARLPLDETMFYDPLHFTPDGFDHLAGAVVDCLVAGSPTLHAATAPRAGDTDTDSP